VALSAGRIGVSTDAIDERGDSRKVAAALTIAVLGGCLVLALTANLLASPSVEDSIARVAAIGGIFGGVALAVIALWFLASLALILLATRASLRRIADTLGVWLEAARDMMWATTCVLLLGMLPVVMLALTAHGSDRPFAMVLEPAVLGATALATGAAATVLTIAVAAR
jgi:hypothetical protein